MSVFSGVHAQLISVATFERTVNDDVSRIPAYFNSPSRIYTEVHSFDHDDIISHLNERVSNFTKRGSGYSLAYINQLYISFVKYSPFTGGTSFVPTPRWIAAKHAVVNVKNLSDDKCFVWAILSALFPVERNAHLLRHYLPYESRLDLTGLVFPMSPKQIPIFERNNSAIAVNCLAFDAESKSFVVLYLSPEAYRRRHVVNLLLLDGIAESTGDSVRHYVYIRHLSRLVSNSQSKHHGTRHICVSCMQGFDSDRSLRQHSQLCLTHNPQQVEMPGENDSILKFDSYERQFPFLFYLVADFEAYLQKPRPDSAGNVVNIHEISGFCVFRVCQYEEFEIPPFVYSGQDAVSKFYEYIFEEARTISTILSRNLPMQKLTAEEEHDFRSATNCQICNRPFTKCNGPVHHHCHVTGRYLFPVCNGCNLRLVPKTCRRYVDNKTYASGRHVLPCVIHNAGQYDTHFILRNFQKKYTEYVTKDRKVKFEDVKLIPLGGEKTLVVQMANVLFLDSYQFLSGSLATLVDTLRRSSKDDFIYTAKYIGTEDFFYIRRVFSCTST